MIPVEVPYPVDGPEALLIGEDEIITSPFDQYICDYTVFVLEKSQDARRQPVSEIPEGFRQLVSVNSTRSVSIKVPENALPVGDVLPKTRKLFRYQYVR